MIRGGYNAGICKLGRISEVVRLLNRYPLSHIDGGKAYSVNLENLLHIEIFGICETCSFENFGTFYQKIFENFGIFCPSPLLIRIL